jgi:hypothetical protein
LTHDSIKKEKANPTYKDVNYFAFETHARKLLEKLLQPVIEQQVTDRMKVEAQDYEI